MWYDRSRKAEEQQIAAIHPPATCIRPSSPPPHDGLAGPRRLGFVGEVSMSRFSGRQWAVGALGCFDYYGQRAQSRGVWNHHCPRWRSHYQSDLVRSSPSVV